MISDISVHGLIWLTIVITLAKNFYIYQQIFLVYVFIDRGNMNKNF
ncbi:hypothetical protein X975_16554, partial [Stegodyphus mimosarum]